MLLVGLWWGDKGLKKKIHWKAWDNLCCSKIDRGLGFKDFKSFNLALLAKQWWRMIHNERSLCHRVLKAFYFPHHSPTKAEKGGNASYLWSSLIEGRKVIEQGAIWRVRMVKTLMCGRINGLKNLHNSLLNNLI